MVVNKAVWGPPALWLCGKPPTATAAGAWLLHQWRRPGVFVWAQGHPCRHRTMRGRCRGVMRLVGPAACRTRSGESCASVGAPGPDRLQKFALTARSARPRCAAPCCGVAPKSILVANCALPHGPADCALSDPQSSIVPNPRKPSSPVSAIGACGPRVPRSRTRREQAHRPARPRHGQQPWMRSRRSTSP